MKTTIKNNRGIIFLIAIISGIIFIPFIGNCPLFDWDEINFAECAREMILSGNYSQVQINYQPFWEKPPFFIWLQAISMNVFGINEFAARLPNAICGIASLISVFIIGLRLHSKKFGLIWALLYCTTLLPHFYFKSGIIDPWFNLFIILSLYQFYSFLNNSENKKSIINSLFSGLFLGLAVLTKGPVALIIFAITIIAYLIWTKQIKQLGSRNLIIFMITSLIVSASWFIVEWLNGNEKIILEFINYQIRLFNTEDSGHSGPFLYHFFVLLIGCFPASFIFIASYLKKNNLTNHQNHWRILMLCLFWVVLLLFSIVKTKILHYSSICYYPLTYIAAIGMSEYISDFKLNKLFKFFYWIIASAIGLSFILIANINLLKPFIIQHQLIEDEFAIDCLKADVNWTGLEFIIGLLFLLGCYLIYVSITRGKEKLFYYGSLTNCFFICFAIAVIVPKIEQYSQHSNIEFYKNIANKNCYVETRGFKSYAQLFYSNRKPSDYNNPYQKKFINETLTKLEKEGYSKSKTYGLANLIWMQNEIVDKPVFIVIKTKNESELLNDNKLHKLYSKNGFSYFERPFINTAK